MVSNKIKKYIFSCVLDYKPIMASQTYIWLSNLLENNIKPKQIIVHLIGETPPEFFDYLNSIGVNIIEKEPFSGSNKYCNKLVQLETFTNQDDFDYVFLMDCDTAVVDLNGISLTDEVYAKVVDFPNPPFDILQNIFAKNDLEIETTESTFPLNGEQSTDWNNCNGGLYIISKDFLKTLAPKWIHYANLCIEQNDVFTDRYSKHADQVGFALAMASLGKKVTHLGIEWNYPTHVKFNVDLSPKILHFHHEFNNDLSLKYVGLNKIDNSILKLNGYLKKMIVSELVNKQYISTVLKTKIFNNHKSHQRDIGELNLLRAIKEVKRPDLLQYIVDLSRHKFGFYTAHYPRVFEYTWIVEQLEDKKDIKVLDIGAGVCPVPLCLTDMGMRVTTVDLHPTVRLLKDKDNWNEWGYLDYSIFNKNIDSKHQDFTKVRTLKRFDCIYSVSVIEHMPRSIRLKMLKRASKLLKKGGELLLTIDIVPDTNDIWNYSEGKQVERQEEHGTMESFKNELLACGFKIVFDHIQREIFESRTDVWYLKAIRDSKRFL